MQKFNLTLREFHKYGWLVGLASGAIRGALIYRRNSWSRALRMDAVIRLRARNPRREVQDGHGQYDLKTNVLSPLGKWRSPSLALGQGRLNAAGRRNCHVIGFSGLLRRAYKIRALRMQVRELAVARRF